MSIATEIQELTQNTAELDGIRTDIRTALTGKGVSASDHNFADFAADIAAIPSGGGNDIAHRSANSVANLYIGGNSDYIISGSAGVMKVNNPNRTDYLGFMGSSNGAWYALKTSASTNFVFNPNSRQTSCRVILKFRMSETQFSGYIVLLGSSAGDNGTELMIRTNRPDINIYGTFNTSSGQYLNTALASDTWYYAVLYNEGSTVTFSLYDEDGELLETKSKTATLSTLTAYMCVGGAGTSGESGMFRGDIDMSELAFEIDSQIVWGQLNAKTQNMGLPT